MTDPVLAYGHHPFDLVRVEAAACVVPVEAEPGALEDVLQGHSGQVAGDRTASILANLKWMKQPCLFTL